MTDRRLTIVLADRPPSHRRQWAKSGVDGVAVARESSSELRDAVIGAMDSSADLSAQILNNPELSQKLLDELVPIIYKGLKATA